MEVEGCYDEVMIFIVSEEEDDYTAAVALDGGKWPVLPPWMTTAVDCWESCENLAGGGCNC